MILPASSQVLFCNNFACLMGSIILWWFCLPHLKYSAVNLPTSSQVFFCNYFAHLSSRLCSPPYWGMYNLHTPVSKGDLLFSYTKDCAERSRTVTACVGVWTLNFLKALSFGMRGKPEVHRDLIGHMLKIHHGAWKHCPDQRPSNSTSSRN